MQKCAERYVSPEKSLGKAAVDAAQAAYTTGAFSVLGLPPEEPLDLLPGHKRRKLAECAEEYVEFTYLARGGVMSFASYPLFALFSDSAQRIERAAGVAESYEQLRLIESVPNFAELRLRLPLGFRDIPRLRSKRHSAAFRDWLATATDAASGLDVVKAYVDAIANRKGFFDTAAGKVTKTIAMTTIGAGVGGLLGGPLGAAMGGVAGKLVEPVADIGLGLADTFLLDSASKGWSPRFFFDDLRKLKLNPEAAAPQP
ncbi:hypothetical protein M9M90_13190 [Phenylobacterium sp. LH3H17]|uniref:hypothetical protein n=1 Tax=Phenylobacterium sp. LH3H17 TaxID=2903901 RepID=UPI0020CA1720|nr:hypothetical protein [Phenylobacterium sp. LH3H17]UTP38172.1 hypothetical protein M9M90_13190 [Phenylobacterium sp. LH3H17]